MKFFRGIEGVLYQACLREFRTDPRTSNSKLVDPKAVPEPLGTLLKMSPEQAMGDRSVDNRSDVYSLGAVFYAMLAGEPPITGPFCAGNHR